MNLKSLKDQELLSSTKELVKKERELLTKILHHLKEVEKRKLFSDLGYSSLFTYCQKELQYSESQAYRRIQAMRLIKEIPMVEEKIEKGALSLINICQAQTYFRETKTKDKAKVLKKLENKSKREGERLLLEMKPERSLPKERQKAITKTKTEVSFIMDEDLKEKLEELRSLLGPKAVKMSLADLIQYMTEVTIQKEKEKKFGKKRLLKNIPSPVKVESKNARYISQATKNQVWQRDKGQCTKCGSKENLHYDHIRPVKLGGISTTQNLRLLCFHCNQRQAIKSFGLNYMEKVIGPASG